MERIFAIGDIHGCCKTFKSLLIEKINIQRSDEIYCIGDYIDRGKDSKGVIDFIIQLKAEGYKIHTLRGNHEQMMLDAFTNKQNMKNWLQNGGGATLRSFGISSINKLPYEYVAFLDQTKYIIETGKYIFVHAGLNFEIPDPFADKEAMLWTRDEYFDSAKINYKLLIHGHTPLNFNTLFKQQTSLKINIDAGCVYNDIPGYGNLAALSLPDKKWICIENID